MGAASADLKSSKYSDLLLDLRTLNLCKKLFWPAGFELSDRHMEALHSSIYANDGGRQLVFLSHIEYFSVAELMN